MPARVVATVMLLQAYEGLSDREACDRLAFDLRWKAAAGLTVGAGAFHPTVLVGMRNRLRASDRPRRLFDDVNTTARAAGLLRGRRRVIDSTPLFDAVATQDTVIQLRAAIRKVLAAADRADPPLAGAVRAALTRDDDYATLGKPPCDWDDPKARRSTGRCAGARRPGRAGAPWMATNWPGRWPRPPSCWGWWPAKTSRLARTGCFRIARQGGPRSADLHRGCRGPPRAQVAGPDLRWLQVASGGRSRRRADHQRGGDRGQHRRSRGHRRAAGPTRHRHAAADTEPATGEPADTGDDSGSDSQGDLEPKDFEVYGDSAYADGATLDEQTARGHDMRTKVPPVRNANGYSKDQFSIDLAAGTVTCPAHHTVAIRAGRRHRVSPLRCAVSVLPAAGGLHESPSGTGDQHPPP